MTILLICDEYPPGKNGGIGTAVQTLGRELVRQGHTVLVAGLYSHTYGQQEYEDDEGVKVWRMRYGLNLGLPDGHLAHRIFNRIPGVIKQRLNGRRAFDRFTRFIEQLIDARQVDVIEAPDWNTFAMRIGFLVQWPAFKAPLVVKSHGSYTYFAREMQEPVKQFLHDIDKALYQRADALSAVSHYTADRNRQLFGISRGIKVLYNAIPVPEPTLLPKAELRVVFSGTLMAKKGVFQLMKAWNKVNAALPGAELIIFGKGNTTILTSLLNTQAAGTVTFKGHVARQELLDTLASATTAVFPSFSETFGLAAIEAMSMGCPVIFSRRSAGPEIVNHQVNGLLIEPSNEEEIAAAIISLLRDKAMQTRFSEAGRNTVLQKFNIVHSAREHVAYYNEVIGHFKEGRKA